MMRVEEAPDLVAWQAIIGRSFVPMSVLVHPEIALIPFRGTVRRLQLGSVGVSIVSAGAHIARRTERDIRLHPADYYKASLQIGGSSTVRQYGRTVELPPGTMALYDATEPDELLFPDENVSLVIQVPRSQLFLGEAKIQGLLAQPIDPLEGTQAFLESQFSIVAECGSAEASHRGQSIVQLLNAILLRSSASGSNFLETDSLDGVKRYTTAHLTDPSLRQEEVAKANFMSVRSLQRAFALQGTSFASWVREQRLERARAWILDTEEPIARIAAECGFASAQHFSRLFRERYKVTARELRKNNM